MFDLLYLRQWWCLLCQYAFVLGHVPGFLNMSSPCYARHYHIRRPLANLACPLRPAITAAVQRQVQRIPLVYAGLLEVFLLDLSRAVEYYKVLRRKLNKCAVFRDLGVFGWRQPGE